MIHINWEYNGKIVKVEPVNREHTYENMYYIEHQLVTSKDKHPKRWEVCYLTGSDKKLPKYEIEFNN